MNSQSKSKSCSDSSERESSVLGTRQNWARVAVAVSSLGGNRSSSWDLDGKNRSRIASVSWDSSWQCGGFSWELSRARCGGRDLHRSSWKRCRDLKSWEGSGQCSGARGRLHWKGSRCWHFDWNRDRDFRLGRSTWSGSGNRSNSCFHSGGARRGGNWSSSRFNGRNSGRNDSWSSSRARSGGWHNGGGAWLLLLVSFRMFVGWGSSDKRGNDDSKHF
ncbi:hypothetical protein EDD86DRAFT_62774 [Gorgonomyces haynaldii]|nr:hypothetical protein EDD86DRAFT_62774 [Gorgonomyces haynaldii]